MVMGFWGPHSRECRLAKAPRHGHKEVSVARREQHGRSITLAVRITFEPSRVSPACVVQAYERVVPITRRPTPQARALQQAEGAPQTQHVGRRQQA
jgi:hypothetical protein